MITPMTGRPSPVSNSPRLAACYARKSNKDDLGVERQFDLCALRASRDGYFIPDSGEYRYGDDFTTGKAIDRNGLDALLDAVRSGTADFEMVFVKDRSRWGRFDASGYHFVLLHQFYQAGIAVYFLDEDKPFDPKDTVAFLKEAFQASLSTGERANLIRRVTLGQLQSICHGFYPGRAVFGMNRWYASRRTGQIRGKVNEASVALGKQEGIILRTADDGTAEIVRDIFQWCADGWSLRKIVRHLETTLALPNIVGEVSWSPGNVGSLLRNPIYVGDLLWRRGKASHPLNDPEIQSGPENAIGGCPKPFRVVGFVPNPAIDRALFSRVQDVLDGNRAKAAERTGRKRGSTKYLLSGLIKCASCGRSYHGFTGRGDRTYYRHTQIRDRNSSCEFEHRYVRVEILDDPINHVIKELLRGDAFLQAATQALYELQARSSGNDSRRSLERIDTELRAARSRITSLTNEWAAFDSSSAREAVKKRLDDEGFRADALEVERKALQTEAVRLKKAQSRLPKMQEVASTLSEAFTKGDALARKRTVRELIHSISLPGDISSATLELLMPAPNS